MAWGERQQVNLLPDSPDKTQVIVISYSEEDASEVRGELRLRRDTIPLQNSIDILGVESPSERGMKILL